MEPDASEMASWCEDEAEIECELGSLIAAASAWTEDEQELDDYVRDWVGSERVTLEIG